MAPRRRLYLVVVLTLFSVSSAQSQQAPPPATGPGPAKCPMPEAFNCAPVSGEATQFAGDHGPMRVRKSIWALSETEIAELRLAFERFRALSSDKIGFQAMANVHCWSCATPGRMIGSKTGNPQPPEDVHATWSFLPFHRAYLYTLEKILGRLVGNDAFALPYWDWNSPNDGCLGSHQKLPPPYAIATLPGSNAANSLWNSNRGVTRDDTMCPAAVGNHRTNLILSLYDSFSLFFGSEHCGSALWRSAHGYVHIWTGGMLNTTITPPGQPEGVPVTLSCPDMGMLGTAARDPLFFAHHANVDRLWDLWIERNGTPDYPEAFLNQSFSFWLPGSGQGGLENPELVDLTAGDGAHRAERMRYTYAEPTCDPAAPVRQIAEGRVKVDRLGSTFESQAKPQYTLAGKTGSKVVLHLDDIVLPRDQAVVLRVFVGDEGDAAKSTCSSENVVETQKLDAICPRDNLVEEFYLVPRGSHLTASSDHSTHVPEKTCAWIALCPDKASKLSKAAARPKSAWFQSCCSTTAPPATHRRRSSLKCRSLISRLKTRFERRKQACLQGSLDQR